MTEYTIDIEDGLASVAENNTPDAISIEEWMAIQVEQSISETHLQRRQQEMQQKAQQQQQVQEIDDSG